MKTITFQHESKIEAEGKHTNGNSIPVVCLDTGAVYTSMSDVAEKEGVSVTSVTYALKSPEHTLKGKRFCRLSQVTQYLSEITQNIRIMEEKAKAYDEILAEQNAIIKAEEERKQAIVKAEEKLARRQEIARKCEERLHQAHDNVAEAERELRELIGDDAQ